MIGDDAQAMTPAEIALLGAELEPSIAAPESKSADISATSASAVEKWIAGGGDDKGRMRAALAELILRDEPALEALRGLVKIGDEFRKPGQRGKSTQRPALSGVDEVIAFRTLPRLKTGLAEIDRVAPWIVGTIFTLMGATGRGKTSLALQIAQHHAETLGGVLVLSFELARVMVSARIVSQRTQATWVEVLGGGLPRQDIERALDIPGLEIDDTPGVDWPAKVRSWVEYQKKTRPGSTPLLVLDYYQIAPGDPKDPRGSLAALMAELGSLCELGIGVLGISKLSRATAKTARSGEAIGDDTMEAGAEGNAIEYWSTVQLTLGKMTEVEGKTIVEGSISKGRFGGGDSVIPIEFDGAHGWFRDAGTARKAAEVRLERVSEKGGAKVRQLRDSIVAALINGALSGRELQKSVGKGRDAITAELKYLAQSGKIELEGVAHQGGAQRWRLAGPRVALVKDPE